MNWFNYENKNRMTLEEQVKFNIASVCESFVNSCYDLGDKSGWNKASKEFWANGIYDTMQTEFNVGNGISYMGDNASKHLRFYGKEKTIKLINEYLENYNDVREFIGN